MAGAGQQQDLIRRIDTLEKKVTELEDKVNQQEIVDAEIKGEIKSLSREFESVKTEVLQLVKDHTDRTWKLVDKSWKIIVTLVSIILVVAGVKISPDLLRMLKMLLGV
jgi:septal ring factor EnvC (AmiA/AmiB activator)